MDPDATQGFGGLAVKVLKWIGIVVGSLVGLIVVAGVVFGLIGGSKLDANHAGEEFGPTALGSADLERGRYLVEDVIACAGCHGEGLEGSPEFAEGFPVDTFAAPNLTPNGVGALLDTDDWVNALRHGVGHDGRRLIVMPSSGFAKLTADDLASVIAHLQQVRGAGGAMPPRDFGFLGQILVGIGMAPDEYSLSQGVEQSDVSPAPSVEYGEYIDSITCATCFIDMSTWTRDDFMSAMTEGKLPDGSDIDPTNPGEGWPMADPELEALWLYVESQQG
jgi:hypothetical protein